MANVATRADFIPFDQMTRTQQAEHLVIAHGMGPDYHDGSDGDELVFTTDADVIAWYESWTSPLDDVHDDDHTHLADEDCFAGVHTHTKED